MANSLKKDWVLTQEAFDRFLVLLDADRERAARRYEELREALAKFFECRGGAFPEEYADETLNRAARQVAEGKEVHDLSGYCYGIARLFLLEVFKREKRERNAINEMHASQEDRDSSLLEQRVECLDRCLDKLPTGDRTLIVQYYQGEKGAKIENRKILAGQLNLSFGTLRMRALRLRQALEECVAICLRAKGVL